jgi:competence protein ComEA
MIMKKKKFVMTGILCGFLLAAGVCYSCTFRKREPSDTFTSVENAEVQTEARTEKRTERQTNGTRVQTDQQSSQKEPEGSKELSLELGSLEPERKAKTKTAKVDTEALLYIHICGAIRKPGVYRATDASRLCEIIKMAGGLTPDADGDYINQAQAVMDGQRIYIPTRKETKKLSAGEYIGGDSSSDSSGDSKKRIENNTDLININQATQKELMELQGIGQAKADSIVEYRETKGKFKTIEELMEIPGIKEGLFSRISSHVTVK